MKRTLLAIDTATPAVTAAVVDHDTERRRSHVLVSAARHDRGADADRGIATAV